jgi:hypothetical protein
MVRELIEDYIRKKDIGSYVDDLWDRIGGRLRAKGINQKDVNRVIKESRKSR